MDTDRNLLFGVLALQADLLTAAQFAQACSAWAAAKDTALADLLVERGWLTPGDRVDVDKFLQRKLRKHHGDARASLAEITTDPVRQGLAGLADPEVHASIAPPTPPPTGHVLLATTDQLPEGRQRYTLSRLHATGGIGRVWVARDPTLGRDVALKELRPERCGSAAALARFLREAQVTGQLEHPGVVPIYEVGRRPDDDAPFYTMRLVRGRTLAEAADVHCRQRAGGVADTLGLRRLVQAVVGVCNAIAYAHSRGVLHRDLKPQNVVLGDYGEVIVLDWGLAKVTGAVDEPAGADTPAPVAPAEADKATEATVAGQVLGTPAYMAPEQAEGRLDLLSPATDVYGLGAVLYQVLTGRPPFPGDDTQTVLRRVVHDPVEPPRSVAPGTPAALDAVCRKALAKRPADRYAAAAALADDLERWLADEPVSAWPEPWAVKARRWVKGHRTLVTGIAAAVVVGLVSLSAATLLLARANDRIQAQNDDLVRANEAIKKEIALKEEQRQLAKARLGQSLEALGLFATDFRLYCEDALVPGQYKATLYERLIVQLERQVVDDPGEEASDDAYRNRVWMYQTLAIVYLDTQQREKARAVIEKALEDVDAWLKVKPGDAYALSFRAAHLSLRADLQSGDNPEAAKAAYLEVLKLRRELAGNPGVDRFTPGRSLMQLADTLDHLHQFEESLRLREQVCVIQIEKGVDADRLFESLDFWAWTCWKAYLGSRDKAKNKAYLEKADEVSRRVLKLRPGSRRTLERWAGITRELGDQEYNLAKMAEADKNGADAKTHGDAALKYYEQLANITRQLAVAPDLMYSRSNYARSFYALGLMQQNLGKQDEARANFKTSRDIREQILRDYADHAYRDHLQIDLLFTLVALGEHAHAVKEADRIQSAPQFVTSPGAQSILYRLACIYSLSVDAVGDTRRPGPLTDADKKLQAAYREKALTALEQSHRLGNRDFHTTRTDTDLISIRDDPRFQKVLEMEKK